ncbi:hypothetical protein Trco_003445 [Trichoderma cornu-damae]|uniref:MARVEL domain-containing protein n=1 Tax=Trichoderma cornu-damae TaxID=654480 RepID=A0A9P8TWK6_9HYPO|nr:hypothetical protein Trco_003445 [Trichoderma cornu-damae]
MAPIGYFGFTVIHFFCFALAIAVCVLYMKDLQGAKDLDFTGCTKLVYAIVVGALTIATCGLYFLPPIVQVGSLLVACWDAVLCVMWMSLFGIFAKMYMYADADGSPEIGRMKFAVWVDLTGAMLWIIAAITSYACWMELRHCHNNHIGRTRFWPHRES